jgi:hypothetical protein
VARTPHSKYQEFFKTPIVHFSKDIPNLAAASMENGAVGENVGG